MYFVQERFAQFVRMTQKRGVVLLDQKNFKVHVLTKDKEPEHFTF